MFPTRVEINLVNEAVNQQVWDKIWFGKNHWNKFFLLYFDKLIPLQLLVKKSGYKQMARKVQHFFGGISVQWWEESPRKIKMNSQKFSEGAL